MLTARARRLVVLLAALTTLLLTGCAAVSTTSGSTGVGAQNRVWAFTPAAQLLTPPTRSQSSCSRPGLSASTAGLASGFCVAAQDAAGSGLDDLDGALCGGQSFSATTRVRLADGRFVSIRRLRVGQRVLATDPATRRNHVERVAAVWEAESLAHEVASAAGGRVEAIEGGFKVTVPYGSRNILVRAMEEGGGRTNYYRLSIPGKQAFTVSGEASTDRALTHIPIGPTSAQDILQIIDQIRGGTQ
jgi:hypothetical protein